MPEKTTVERARQARKEGKAPSTQAGEFVRDEIEHTREGKHGARSTKQAIAIGLSKARRVGVELPPPKKGVLPEETRHNAKREYVRAQQEGANQRRRSVPAQRRERLEEKSVQQLRKRRSQSKHAQALGSDFYGRQ